MKKPTPSEQLAMTLRDILRAEGQAIGCEECFEFLDRCAELVESGQPLDDLYPQVKKHLEDCICCSQELEALLTALAALSPPKQEPAPG